MPPPDKTLVDAAIAARRNAYAPYSHFHVGAACRTSDGSIVDGCNVENASYGLTLCAERNAVSAAVAQGHRSFTELVIAADGDRPPYPCGACRQVLAEFAGPDLPIHVTWGNPTQVETLRLGDLLPKAFSLGSCPQKRTAGCEAAPLHQTA